ncbi:MAG: hypothetical protein LBG99_05220 [Propionibacteriaceae bacterium]|jgi:hypothetical protein|nr:hypothetical protein [Propionibacteriaceae bacterium]
MSDYRVDPVEVQRMCVQLAAGLSLVIDIVEKYNDEVAAAVLAQLLPARNLVDKAKAVLARTGSLV